MTDLSWEQAANQHIHEAKLLEQQGQIADALTIYERALDAIPETEQFSDLAMMILCCIGELNFSQQRFDYAFEDFSDAIKCDNALGNPYIHMRLGQLQYQRGNIERAADELMRVYMAAGEKPFHEEDPKYYELIKHYIEPTSV